MLRACRANIVPCAITNKLRSFDKRMIRSCAKPPASGRAPSSCCCPGRSPNGITAIDARRAFAGTICGSSDDAGASADGASCTTAAGTVETTAPGGCDLAARQAAPNGRQSSPSASNKRTVRARCSSPSGNWPLRPSVASTSSCARRSNGASSSHFSRWANACCGSSCARLSTRCSRTARWPARKRRRCASSQAEKRGLRSISSPSRNSPVKRADSTCSASRSSWPMPGRKAWSIERASTVREPSDKSSRTASSTLSMRGRCGSSSTPRALLRHQRNSPRGSCGTSQSSSHRWLRVTAHRDSAR